MSTPTKWMLTAVGLALIFFAPVDAGLTAIPGVVIIAAVWGIKL